MISGADAVRLSIRYSQVSLTGLLAAFRTNRISEKSPGSRIEIEHNSDGMAILIRIGVDGDNLTGVRLECGAHLGRLLRVGELVGDEFDHEAPALADLSHARVHDDCAIGVGRRRPAPELTISVRDRPALLDPALRTPLRDDVVVVFGIGGNFEQHDLAVSPIADRFDPKRGPELPVGVVVAERFEIAVALQQSETARILVAEGGDLQRFAIGDGAPYPFSRAGQDLQTGHVIDVLAHASSLRWR